jgi:hypothetical protein
LRRNTGEHELLLESGRPVEEARDALARRILELDPVPEIAVLLDDDAWWEPGAVETLVRTLAALPGVALLAGWFSARVPYETAMARRVAGDIATELSLADVANAARTGGSETVVPIEECGLHACAIRTSALRALGDAPFALEPHRSGEDLAFCERLRARGFALACAPAIAFAHVEEETSLAYAPGVTPFKIVDGIACSLTPAELAHVPSGETMEVRDRDGRTVVAFVQPRHPGPRRSYGPALDGRAAQRASPNDSTERG